MAKLTRKSYKRKKIAFAAVILGGVALVSSGFAAWVLSHDVTQNATGSANVGKVEEANLVLTLTSKMNVVDASGNKTSIAGDPTKTDADSDKFCFEPVKEDNSGRVRWDKTNYEILSITYGITVTSIEKNLSKVNVNFQQNVWIDAVSASAKKYIVAPACYTEANGVDIAIGDQEGNLKETSSEEGGKTTYKWACEYTVAFQWGEAFDATNPSKFYDDDAKTKDEKGDYKPGMDDESVKATLNDLYSLNEANKSFKIIFTASVN